MIHLQAQHGKFHGTKFERAILGQNTNALMSTGDENIYNIYRNVFEN